MLSSSMSTHQHMRRGVGSMSSSHVQILTSSICMLSRRHYRITASSTVAIPTACPASPVFVTRQVRGWSRLDRDSFRAAIRSGPLCHDDEFYKEMKVTELFDLYNSTLQDLLDNFLPLHKVKSRYQPSLLGSMLTAEDQATGPLSGASISSFQE